MIKFVYLGALILTVIAAYVQSSHRQIGGTATAAAIPDPEPEPETPYNDELDGDLSNAAYSDGCLSENDGEDAVVTPWRLVSAAMYGAAALSPGANENPVAANQGLRFLTHAAFKSSPCLYNSKTVCH